MEDVLEAVSMPCGRNAFSVRHILMADGGNRTINLYTLTLMGGCVLPVCRHTPGPFTGGMSRRIEECRAHFIHLACLHF